MLTHRSNSGSLIGGAVLIGLGLLFLAAQFFNFQNWGLLWPLFVLGMGGLFFIGMFSGGKPAAALAIPGSLFGVIGLMLLLQNATGYWSSWSYGWTIIIMAAGLGLFIAGHWGDDLRRRRVGLQLLEIGLVLFVIFGAFFELLLGGWGGSAVRQAILPILLIVAGLYLVIRRDALWPGWFGWLTTPGSGHVITETRSVADFRGVSFSAFGDLTVKPGDTKSLMIEAEDNVLPEFRTEVRDGTLHIELARLGGMLSVRPTRPIRMNLTVKQLTRVALSGAGNTLVSGLTTDQLQAVLSGAGAVRLDGLDTQQLRATLSGAGGLTASGRSGQTFINVSGVGAFHGDNLQSASATANLSGTGGVTLWVTDDLHATISGLGRLAYYGHPSVTKDITGLGAIQMLGDR